MADGTQSGLNGWLDGSQAMPPDAPSGGSGPGMCIQPQTGPLSGSADSRAPYERQHDMHPELESRKIDSMVRDMLERVESAGDTNALLRIAGPLWPLSFNLGVAYGIAEKGWDMAAGLLSLGRTFLLADLHDVLDSPFRFATPLPSWLVAKAAQKILGKEVLEKAAQDRAALLAELKKVVLHPLDFIEHAAGEVKKDYLEKWERLKRAFADPSLANSFETGRVTGEVLVDVVLTITTVGDAIRFAKWAAELPALARLARSVERAGASALGKGGEASAVKAKGLKESDPSPMRAERESRTAKSSAQRRADVERNTVIWSQDGQGRTVQAEGTLRQKFAKLKRSSQETAAQRQAAFRGKEGDVGGHLVGHQFVGDQGSVNLFPQDMQFNNSAFRKMENEIARKLEEGKEVNFSFELIPPGAKRPDVVRVRYRIIDPATGKHAFRSRVFKNEAGQVFKRRKSIDRL